MEIVERQTFKNWYKIHSLTTFKILRAKGLAMDNVLQRSNRKQFIIQSYDQPRQFVCQIHCNLALIFVKTKIKVQLFKSNKTIFIQCIYLMLFIRNIKINFSIFKFKQMQELKIDDFQKQIKQKMGFTLIEQQFSNYQLQKNISQPRKKIIIKKQTKISNLKMSNHKFIPFHVALPVNSLQKAHDFYCRVLGFRQGRSHEDEWIGFDFYGHQYVCHFVSSDWKPTQCIKKVDGYDIPIPHYGSLLTVSQFKQLRDKLISLNVKFLVQPHLRFQGKHGQQWSMFLKDPSGNTLEFKAFTNPEEIFNKNG